MNSELPCYSTACISSLRLILLLTAGCSMSCTMSVKLHINKTPLTNNRGPKLRSNLHKTLFKFGSGRETPTKQT